MAELKDKVENALSEARTLILGVQVLVGFQYRSVFDRGFENLPPSSQYLKVAALALMLVTAGLLMAPAAYHRVIHRGRDTHRFHGQVTLLVAAALLPFAVGLGIDLYVAGERLLGSVVASSLAVVGVAVVVTLWYGLGIMHEAHDRHHGEEQTMRAYHQREAEGTPLKDRIKQVLTETRIVLPGAQALLGFQFVVFLSDSFEKLPRSLQYVHLASLLMIALSTVLLMAPAAYHRIAERGEDSEHFLTFASRMVTAAMAVLAFGLVGDFYLVVRKVLGSPIVAAAAAALLLAFFYGLWFGVSLIMCERPGPTRAAPRPIRVRQGR